MKVTESTGSGDSLKNQKTVPNRVEDQHYITILSVCSSYPRFQADSASIFLRHLNKSIDKKVYRVIVLAPDHEMVANDVRDPGIEVIYFRYFFKKLQLLTYGAGILPNVRKNPLVLLLVPFYISGLCLKMFTLLRRRKPSLIHAHWIVPQGYIAALIGKLFSIPVVITAHGGDAFALNSLWFRFIKRSSLKRCTYWTANTQATALAIDPIEQFRNKLRIIPMGVDTSFFSHDEEPRGESRRDEFILLFVGRLVAKKGAAVLVEAYHLLPPTDQARCKVYIIGSGTELSALKERVATLGYGDSISLLGTLPNAELVPHYRNADLLIVPSIVDDAGDTEGQGVVIIEAMASGLPVLASKVGGIPDIVENNATGLLFGPGDANELSQKINYAMSHQADLGKLADNALAMVHERFDSKVVADSFQQVFSDAVFN